MITPEMLAKSGTEHGHQAALFCQAQISAPEFPELKYGLFAIPNGGLRTKVTAANLKVEGVKRGIADVQLAVARGIFHALFIEMKKPGEIKGQSNEQKEFQAHCNANG